MTKERPIIFDGESVRAILAGTKTQTRRAMKPQQPTDVVSVSAHGGVISWTDARGKLHVGGRTCPCGAPGDLLWVRETFAPRYFDNGAPGYMADWTDVAADYVPKPKWKPSIHMPRALSRISLRVTSVRVERVQDISEADAIAEGIYAELQNVAPSAYAARWDSINAKRGFPWSSNPHVWVVAFEAVTP